MGTSRDPACWAVCWSHGYIQFVTVTELALWDMHLSVLGYSSIKGIFKQLKTKRISILRPPRPSHTMYNEGMKSRTVSKMTTC